MAKNEKNVSEIEFFEIGNASTNKLIAKEIDALQLRVEALSGDIGEHIAKQVQPHLDQFDHKNDESINSAALLSATNIFNHLSKETRK